MNDPIIRMGTVAQPHAAEPVLARGVGGGLEVRALHGQAYALEVLAGTRELHAALDRAGGGGLGPRHGGEQEEGDGHEKPTRGDREQGHRGKGVRKG
jgi:hypothetical protein